MSNSIKQNFVRQQGFEGANEQGCALRYPALMLQPRIVGVVILFGLVLQSAAFFLVLSALLWWNVLLPALNPFDALYNHLIARHQNRRFIEPAPPPRRFAQGMAATFMVGIGICLLAGWQVAAWIIEGLLVAAFAALIFGRFCLGAYLYYLLRGKVRFANRTLPWAHG